MKIDILNPDEQAILVDWYNSLISTGRLNWNINDDLCGQTGIICGFSSPYFTVTTLYSLSFFHFVSIIRIIIN